MDHIDCPHCGAPLPLGDVGAVVTCAPCGVLIYLLGPNGEGKKLDDDTRVRSPGLAFATIEIEPGETEEQAIARTRAEWDQSERERPARELMVKRVNDWIRTTLALAVLLFAAYCTYRWLTDTEDTVPVLPASETP
ncbi:hypothetical protein [Chondromyces apiculatus]|uniref:Uncharacterized protein n=1 Tax=Chondromyces apiculatus DSM 436 TaxID=1192034 RepID=A0A017TE63_9BACT|nr:hypothetical protein [Chondromyces apiculatus]EYF07100.1 Hypothetical protein CAP_0579 [Chondromyces apiculatus DSM 436]